MRSLEFDFFRWIAGTVVVLGLLAGCTEKTPLTITGPSAPGAQQTVAVNGPAVHVQDSPCAGNVQTASGPAAKGDGNNPGTTSSSSANTPNCSSVVTPPPSEEAAP